MKTKNVNAVTKNTFSIDIFNMFDDLSDKKNKFEHSFFQLFDDTLKRFEQ